jgi:hypothetical protein
MIASGALTFPPREGERDAGREELPREGSRDDERTVSDAPPVAPPRSAGVTVTHETASVVMRSDAATIDARNAGEVFFSCMSMLNSSENAGKT